MRAERLEIEFPDLFFEVKDDFLYYLDKESRVVMINLKNVDKTEFKFDNYPKCDKRDIKIINGDIYLYHYLDNQNKRHLSKLKFNTENMSSGSGGTVELTSDLVIEGEFKNWNNSYYRSAFVYANSDCTQIVCLEKNKLYDIQGLSLSNPVFTRNGRFYYVTSEGNALFLNSFALDDQNQTAKEELNGAVQMFTDSVGSCVFGDNAYFVLGGTLPKIFKLNLSYNTIEDITVMIDDFDMISYLKRTNHDCKSIYVTDNDKTSMIVKSLFKIEVQTTNLDPLTCPRCETVFDNPKILKECGHSICESCEKDMLKQFVDANNRKLNCPVADCKTVVTLNKGEELSTNRAFTDLVSKAHFTCELCARLVPWGIGYYQCNKCKESPICGDCLIKEHTDDGKLHDHIKLEIISENQKTKVLDRFKTMDNTELNTAMQESVNQTFEKFKEGQDLMKSVKKEITQNNRLTNVELEEKSGKLENLQERLEKLTKAIREACECLKVDDVEEV